MSSCGVSCQTGRRALTIFAKNTAHASPNGTALKSRPSSCGIRWMLSRSTTTLCSKDRSRCKKIGRKPPSNAPDQLTLTAYPILHPRTNAQFKKTLCVHYRCNYPRGKSNHGTASAFSRVCCIEASACWAAWYSAKARDFKSGRAMSTRYLADLAASSSALVIAVALASHEALA